MSRYLPLLMLLLLTACQTTTPRQETIPGHPDFVMPDVELSPPDLTGLADRKIFIDPGHGGPFTGAVAPLNALRESDVNLRVSLALETLLSDAGAEVSMTRRDDTVPVPDSVSRDLSARAEAAANAGAEIFVSVHHNAHIAEGSDKNDLEL